MTELISTGESGSAWHFLKSCKHLLNKSQSNSCPFCKLINRSIENYLKEDQRAKQRLIEEVNTSNAISRYNVLLNWSKTQLR
jgi:hypothetical protein